MARTQILNDAPQQTKEWLIARKGVVSGTRAASLIGTPAAFEKLGYEIAGELLAEPREDLADLDPRDRGNYLEAEARATFTLATGLPVYTVGMIVAGATQGYSPDGVSDPLDVDNIVYGVEIKSPESANHVKYIINGGIPKDYIAQVLRPFTMLPSLETMYFVSYNPEVTACPLYIYEAKRENFTDDIAKMVSQEELLNKNVDKYINLVKVYGNALNF